MSTRGTETKSTRYFFGVFVRRREDHLSYVAIFAPRQQIIFKETYPEETAAALAADMVKIVVKVLMRR